MANLSRFGGVPRSSIYLSEQAAAQADAAGSGQIWISNDTPNELWFTDDAGNDKVVSGLKTETVLFRPPDGACSGGSSFIENAGGGSIFDAAVFPDNGALPWWSWMWKTPKRCDQGQYRFRVFWSPTNTNTNNLIFGMYGQPYSDGDATTISGNNGVTITETPNGTIDDLNVTAWSAWTNMSVWGTVSAETMVWLRLQRNTSSAGDTFTGSAEVYLVEMQYVSNTMTDE